jgi:hypothetical protein
MISFLNLDDSTKEIQLSKNTFQLIDIKNTYNIKIQNKEIKVQM